MTVMEERRARREAESEAVALALAQIRHVEATQTELLELLRGMELNHVLLTAVVTLDANGVWSQNWPTTYAGVAVFNTSGATITATAGTQQAAAPTGPASAQVPAESFARVPLVAKTLTLYGPPGATVTVVVFTRPQPPAAASLGGAGFSPGTYSPPVNVAAGVVSVQLAAANPARRGLIVSNDSTAKLYLLFGAGAASAANYTYVIPGGASFEMPEPIHTGAIQGVWGSATGSAAVTDVT